MSDSHPNAGGEAGGAKKLVCPQCKALYLPSKPTFGRRVRCRHCGHVWRDESRAAGAVAGALGAAAAEWGKIGSTVLSGADHGSTVGRVVAGLQKAAAPAASEWIGKKLGRYEIKSVLGQGAMGYVYEARDPELQREVAIKMLPRRFEREHEPVGVRMFVQEARVAAKLAHPNIVTIYEIGQDEGYYFFVMERVRGTTLAQLIEERGPLPANQACYVIAQAARGLAAAHQMGIVHRDVKPSNIMIDSRGQVKVTDFGLADVEGIEGVAEVRERPMGTPGWISPESARGERATALSDIYSLGLTLYAALTGKRFFHSPDKAELIRLGAEAESVQREQLPASWPPRLAEVVVQCLQARPKDRYQSAEMLAADLVRALAPDTRDATLTLGEGDEKPVHMVKAVAPKWSWVALGALVLIALSIAVWFWRLR